MGLYDDWKNSRDAEEMTEEAAYALAVREYEAGQRQDGAWGKAFAQFEGNFDKAHALYIKIRAEQILRDAALLERLEAEEPEQIGHEKKSKKKFDAIGCFWMLVAAAFMGVVGRAVGKYLFVNFS